MSSQSENTFGDRVRTIRQHLKMNQVPFAKKLVISPATLSDIENNKYKPGHDIIIKFVKEYNVELDYLILGKGPMFADGYTGSKLDDALANDPSTRKFLHYFASSNFVRFNMLAQFEKLCKHEKDWIDTTLEEDHPKR